MSYATPYALRAALEHRLHAKSVETGISLDRLRRRVLFERIVARLDTFEPERWVLKGGMALEVRLRDDARLTKDIDLGLRDEVPDAEDLHERLIDALTVDPDRDGFVLTAAPPVPLGEDSAGQPTWRAKITAHLADRLFGRIQLDISPRAYELDTTDRLALPNSLAFAGIPSPEVEIVDVHRHAAEKLHAMLRDFGDRENSRVRDLVDLVILIEHDLLTPDTLASAARKVWTERDGGDPPNMLGPLPESWPYRYERLAAEQDIHTQSFRDAVASVTRLWAEMFPTRQ